jgi:hypothetical protein
MDFNNIDDLFILNKLLNKYKEIVEKIELKIKNRIKEIENQKKSVILNFD